MTREDVNSWKNESKNIKINAKPIFEDNKIIVYYADSPQACISYKGNISYGWCVARSDSNNMYYTYRFKEHEPAFYFVKNKEKTNQEFNFLNSLRNAATLSFIDKYHFFVIQVVKGANPNNKEQKQYIVTSALNDGDVQMSWNEIVKIEPDLAGKEDLFISKPLETKEKELYSRFKNGISDEEFTKLPYDEKDMYLNVYVRLDKPLSESQFASLPYDLKNKYIGFGVGLTPEQLKTILLGAENINKLNELSVNDVIELATDVENKNKLADLFLKYKKELTDNDVFALLLHAKNKDEMAKILGLENINKLSHDSFHNLLGFSKDNKNLDEMRKVLVQYKTILNDDNIFSLLIYSENENDMAKLFLKYKKELTDDDVSTLLTFSPNKDGIAKILGSENISKLTDKDVNEMLHFSNNDYYQMKRILQQYGRI